LLLTAFSADKGCHLGRENRGYKRLKRARWKQRKKGQKGLFVGGQEKNDLQKLSLGTEHQ